MCVYVYSCTYTYVIIPREAEGYSVEFFGLSVRLSVRLSVCLSVCPKNLYAHLLLAATVQQIDTYTI